MNFNFKFYGNIYFGQGERLKAVKIIKEHNFKDCAVIIDKNLLGIQIFDEFINMVENEANCTIIECDISEPTYNKLEEKRINKANEKIDVFLGIGGGSALDMAKGLAVLYSNEGPALSFRGFDKFNEPINPIIAIPTTAGTGSEITPNASFIDSVGKKKMGINGEAIRPTYSILDPELTLTCPNGPTIAAAVDSVVHGTEAFIAKSSSNLAKFFASEGIRIVLDNLNSVVADHENINARTKVMYGAFLSAIALMNSGTGPSAALSYPLSVHFGVPHGLGGGFFLPHVVDYNISKEYFEYGNISANSDNKRNLQKSAIEFKEKLFQVWKSIGVPTKLSELGIKKSDFELIINDTMQLKGALDQNPVPFYEEQIKLILNKLT